MADDTKQPTVASALTEAAAKYATAKVASSASNLGSKITSPLTGGNGDKPEKDDDSPGLVGRTVEKLGEGASPVKAAVTGAASTVKDKVKGLFTRKGGSKRPHNIVEDIIVGVTPEVCWAAFTQWEEFPSFMKGPTSVTRGDETSEDELEDGQHPLEGEETNWNAKIFMSKRSWKSKTVDYDPPHRLSWTSEGAKGTVDGTITLTPIGDNATLMAVEIEYRSKGIVEWTGQRWHTVGKRVRLDMKHFRRYVMRTEPDELEEMVEENDDLTTEEPEEETNGTEDEAAEPAEQGEDQGEADEGDGGGDGEEGGAAPEDEVEEPEEEVTDEEEPEPEPRSRTAKATTSSRRRTAAKKTPAKRTRSRAKKAASSRG